MFSKAKSPATKQNAADPTTQAPSTEPKSSPAVSRQSTSVIGSNTQVHGDINSDEDLTIEGQVIGIVTCQQHTVTLGSDGSLHGDAYAHTLRVSGKVEGNLIALHKTIVHGSADVTGTITTPCLVLEDGCIFHGSIDMNPDNEVFASVFTSQPQKSIAAKTTHDSNRSDAEETGLANDADSSPADAS